MALHRDKTKTVRQGFKMSCNLGVYQEEPTARMKGKFLFEMRDAKSGTLLEYWEKENIITLDAGILMARLLKDSTNPNPGAHNGILMLAVGTGATGNLLSPDAPQAGQRRLNAEIARKAFVSTQFRNQSGVAVAYPTNVVDYTTTFGESEAVGPLNEMSLLSPASTNPLVTNPIMNGPSDYDPTLDVTGFDLGVNYLTFSVVSKPATAILTVTWRLTH